MVKADLEEIELNDFRNRLKQWEDDALPLLDEIKKEVTYARKAMDADPPDLYAISNSLVDLSILNIRLIERIVNAKYFLNEAKGIYESRREGWKIKLVQGYGDSEGVPAGVADSMKIGKVREEYELMNQAEHNYDNANLTRRAVEKALDSIRSKLSYESKHET